MVRQPHVCLVSTAQFLQQVRDVQAGTNIEEWLIKRQIKLKHLASRPSLKVYVTGHRGIVPHSTGRRDSRGLEIGNKPAGANRAALKVGEVGVSCRRMHEIVRIIAVG